ncbi:MAG: helix-turn-helix transcriptional regulator [Candidatus Saccharibacteria bacterium]|nr:helix-turn-helix transcriptional regulator [Candidatus Saccharibacteria bacterium]
MNQDKLVRTIGKNLRKVRLSKGLTQLELAEKTGLNVSHYARIERGETTPNIFTLGLLVKALKVQASDILPF